MRSETYKNKFIELLNTIPLEPLEDCIEISYEVLKKIEEEKINFYIKSLQNNKKNHNCNEVNLCIKKINYNLKKIDKLDFNSEDNLEKGKEVNMKIRLLTYDLEGEFRHQKDKNKGK